MPSDALFKQLLAILQDDDANLGDQKKAAIFFRDRAQQGDDIEAAVPLLLDLYGNCHQVPVMEPAADAVILHYLRLGQYDAIIAFIQKDTYKTFSLQSVDRIVKSGKDITPLIPRMLQFLSKENYGVFHIVRDFLNQIPSEYSKRLKQIADVLVGNKALRVFLPFLVQEGSIDHMDMAPVIPALATLLMDTQKRVRDRTATAMRWAVEDKTDFSAIINVLEQSLGRPKEDPEIRKTIAYCLAYSHLVNKSWGEVARLQTSPISEIRQGIYNALGVRFNNKDRKIPQVLSFLLEGFNDPDKVIRQRVSASIMEAGRKKTSITPDESILGNLLTDLKTPGPHTELSEYLYHISAKDCQTAQFISSTVKGEEFKASNAAEQLAEKLRGLLAGEYSPVCSICRHIPRSNGGTSPPNEAQIFNLPTPSLDSVSLLRKCPECGTHYYYMYAEEMDDMSVDRTMELRRLDPAETLQRLQGTDRAEYEASLPDVLKRYHADLQHPVEFARVEAAWAITRYAVSKQHWDEVLNLLHKPDTTTRSTVFHELLTFNVKDLPIERLRDLLDAAINDEDSKIRYDAAGILSQEIIRQKDYDTLLRLIEHAQEEVVSATTYWIWMAVRNSQFDISRIREKLGILTKSKHSSIRNHARYALMEAKSTPGESPIDFLIANLRDANEKVREDAAMSLGHLAEEKTDISKAFPALVKVLKDRTVASHAITALLRAASWTKLDISVAVPALTAILEREVKKPSRLCGEIEQTLYNAMKNGTKISAAYPALAKILATGKIGVEIFQKAMQEGDNLAALELDFKRYLEKKITDFDYDGEFMVKVLTYIYTRGRRWEDLKALLEHQSKYVPGTAASWLAEVPDDITPVIPVLVKNVLHNYWYVRDSSVRALLRFSRQEDRNLDLIKSYFSRLSSADLKALQKADKLHALSELMEKIHLND